MYSSLKSSVSGTSSSPALPAVNNTVSNPTSAAAATAAAGGRMDRAPATPRRPRRRAQSLSPWSPPSRGTSSPVATGCRRRRGSPAPGGSPTARRRLVPQRACMHRAGWHRPPDSKASSYWPAAVRT
jgi:hypothetical protein